MANALASRLIDSAVLEESSLATVMSDCIIVANAGRGSHTIISFAHIAKISRLVISFPALLTIAAALLVIAAAAYSSKQEDKAALPFALVGLVFLISYFLSRRAVVEFRLDREAIVTPAGSLPEASRVIEAVRSAQKTYSAAAASA